MIHQNRHKWLPIEEMLNKVPPEECVPKLHETLKSVL